MTSVRYTARIGESLTVVQDVPYEALVAAIVEFTARAATARSADESEWEHEELRRRGLGCVQIFRERKAIWTDSESYGAELAEAAREHVEDRFNASNELDPGFFEKLDRDIRERWRLAGYDVAGVSENMKALFVELESDANDRAADARNVLVDEILASSRSEAYGVRRVSDGTSPNISR